MLARVLVLLLLATPASAGLVFRYTSAISGNPFKSADSGTVWISDGKYRHVLDPDPSNPRAWDVAIFNGTETLLVNAGNQTWYREKKLEPPLDAKLRGKPKVSHQLEGQETIAGRQTSKHVIRVEYRLTENFGPSRVGSKGSVLLMLWVTPDLPSIPMRRFIRTEFPEIDDEIFRVLETIEGMPLRYQLAATRTYDGGGVPKTLMTTTTFSDFDTVDVPASRFEVPKGYREQEPIVGVPGVMQR